MKNVYDKLSKIPVLEGKLSLSQDQFNIEIEFHEYMHMRISDDYLLFNYGLTHWHPGDDDEIIQEILQQLRGELVYVEWRGLLTRPRGKAQIRICSNALKIMTPSIFEKRKKRYMGKKHLRVYTGQGIIKRSHR